MSKGSLFWANARGKLGEAVYYRSGGEQRTRTYVKNIKNPKSKSQMINRIQMANLAAVYRNLRPILDSSFPNKNSNQSAWNEFVRLNKRVNGAVCPKQSIENGLCVPHKMTMAKGTIVAPQTEIVGSGDGNGKYGFWLKTVSSSEAGTLQALYAKLLELNNLPANTKMTVVFAEYADEGYEVGYLTFDPITGITTTVNTSQTLSAQQINNGGQMFLQICEPSEETDIAIIFSYTDANGKLQVSTAEMKTASDSLDDTYGGQFIGPDGELYLEVLNTYGYNSDSVLATR